ncbi:hypothetical protein [Morganella morganii]|uniref:Uncharacterized protein n=1 Tax=Morganella morganii TaxID=582 RepID=A0AAI9HPM4_MORMO|nr:hypothetical protein [Morganella morganii]EKW8759912.1 hypothetical protein [Morganella morganii]SHL43200.1 hypothetical protein SAMN05216301_0467 [Morganella morganii]HCE8947064.1 hypothetical protein [Morganella morganii]
MDKYIVCYEGLGLTGSVLFRSHVAINTDISRTEAERFVALFNNAAAADAEKHNINAARYVIVNICKL